MAFKPEPPILEYATTNESLDAIMAGLDVNSADSILSVAGCGDQVFAFTELAKKVRVADINPKQIELTLKRMELLSKGDYEGFLNVEQFGCFDGIRYTVMNSKTRDFNLQARKNYFLKAERLDMIRTRLDIISFEREQDYERMPEEALQRLKSRFEIFPNEVLAYGHLITNARVRNPECDGHANIFGLMLQITGYNKMYISNISLVRGPIYYLTLISENLPLGGLVYISSTQFQEQIQLFDQGDKFPENLKVEEQLTQKANMHEQKMRDPWQPIVYQRV